MTLLDVIDLNIILTVNSMWENKFSSHGRKWTRLWFASYENIKIQKPKNPKLFNTVIPNFLYSNSYHFFNIIFIIIVFIIIIRLTIIIILIFLSSTVIVLRLFLCWTAPYILLVYKKK